MQGVSPDVLLKQLNWRYAVKTFDASRRVPAETWRVLEEALVLSPSSYGLQPWRFYVVQDAGVRAKLRAVSWNQSQITDASHLVVLARKVEITAGDVEAHVRRMMEVRGVAAEALKGLRDMMMGSVSSPGTLPGGSMETYTRSQVYIALGVLLSSAAMLGVDACPMEGFDPPAYDEILGLRAEGYAATVVAAVGYRSAGDWLAPLAKVRAKHADVVKHV